MKNKDPNEEVLLRHLLKDKWRLIKAIRDGQSNDKILKSFPFMSVETLAAYRAHDTRGTYD